MTDFFYLVSNIPYQPDPPGYEQLQRPAVTLKLNYGDCDDKAILFGSFCVFRNITSGVSIVSEKPDKNFHHVFNFIIFNGNIIDMDCTYQNSQPGKRRVWAKRKNLIIYERI